MGRLHADKWSQLCRPCTDPAQTLLILQTLRGVRAADVIADTYTVCYTLSRKAFNELLGPIEDMWRFEALRKVRRSAAGACWRMQLCHWGVQTRWGECVLACSRHTVCVPAVSAIRRCIRRYMCTACALLANSDPACVARPLPSCA